MSKYCVFMLVPSLALCSQDPSNGKRGPVSVWQELDEMERKIQELMLKFAAPKAKGEVI